jgi:hypothetical protein
MKILFLQLFSRILRFLIESNFKSCREISLEILLIFLSKRSISVKKPAGWKKIFNFKCNLLSLGELGAGWIFFREST